jgi:hypothetical protein
MSKLFASAQPPESWLTRRARPRPDAPHAVRAAEPPEAPAQRASSAPALDADMLNFVQKFEETYAQIAPSTDETLQRADAGDLFPEFPDIFEELTDKQAADAPTVASERVELQPLWSPDTIPAPRRERRPEVEDEIDLDEALSILRAPQVERAEAELRQARDTGRRDEEHTEQATSRYSDTRDPQVARAPQAASLEAPTDWSTRSHRPHSIAIAAAVLALVVGISVGYLAGHTPGTSKYTAAVGAGQPSAAKLRLDYDLHKP